VLIDEAAIEREVDELRLLDGLCRATVVAGGVEGEEGVELVEGGEQPHLQP